MTQFNKKNKLNEIKRGPINKMTNKQLKMIQ